MLPEVVEGSVGELNQQVAPSCSKTTQQNDCGSTAGKATGEERKPEKAVEGEQSDSKQQEAKGGENQDLKSSRETAEDAASDEKRTKETNVGNTSEAKESKREDPLSENRTQKQQSHTSGETSIKNVSLSLHNIRVAQGARFPAAESQSDAAIANQASIPPPEDKTPTAESSRGNAKPIESKENGQNGSAKGDVTHTNCQEKTKTSNSSDVHWKDQSENQNGFSHNQNSLVVVSNGKQKVKNPPASGTSSPVILDDEGLLPTDEELPPYDFGADKASGAKKMPWDTSGLPSHIQFLASKVPNNVKPAPLHPALSTDHPLLSLRKKPSSGTNGSSDQMLDEGPLIPGTERAILMQRGQEKVTTQSRASERCGPHSDQAPRSQSQSRTPLQGINAGHKQSEVQPEHVNQNQNRPTTQPGSQSQRPTSQQYPTPEAGYAQPGGNNYFPGHHYRYPYPPAPTAAVKPIRRLAKIRPYANQAIPVSAEEIQKAIPKDASAVFHVMDRRVNLDAFALDETSVEVKVPVYSLLRAWVQDDPYRQIPPSPTTFPSATLDWHIDRREFKLPRERQQARNNDTTNHQDRKRKAGVDVTGYLQNNNSLASGESKSRSIESLKLELVNDARKKQRETRKGYKQNLTKTAKRLQERGILRFTR